MQTIELEQLAKTQEQQRPVRELHARVGDGLQVQLLWCEVDDLVFVRVADLRNDRAFSIPVQEGQSPLEVFHHPYAYAPAS
ncbi:MAG TPA: hypothetical protein VHU61_18705 [Solirubrobacteraceae bacterium]|jgi:hypothetical protein|nr:hypothetical protein [Solirubrobacteraceae bacterium]